MRYLPQNALHPSDNLVTGRVGGLVQVDHTRVDVGLQVTLERRATGGDRGEMTSSNKDYPEQIDISMDFTLDIECLRFVLLGG
jgi:hypothetical protein